MGQVTSSPSPSPPPNPPGTIDTGPKPTCQRHHIFPRSFKRLLTRCRGSKGKLVKNYKESFHGNENLSPNTNVILPTVSDPLSRLFIAIPSSPKSKSKSRISKHSFVSLALSKLAFFAQASKEKMVDNRMPIRKQKLSFHKTTSKKKTKKSKPPSASSSSQTEAKKQDANNNQNRNSVNLLELSKYDAKLREQLIKKLLMPSKNPPKTPEEIFKRNLLRFERLLTITTASSEDDSVSEEDGETSIKNCKKSSGICTANNRLPRIISTSKNRVEIDVHFMDWIKSRISNLSKHSKQDPNGNPTASSKKVSHVKRNASNVGATGSLSVPAKTLRSTATTRNSAKSAKVSLVVPPGQKSERTSKAKSSKSSLRTGDKSKSSWSKSSASRSYYSVAVGQTLVRDSEDLSEVSADENNNLPIVGKGHNAKGSEMKRNSLDPTFVKKGCCAGKGHRAGGVGGAPPAYLDYGGGGAGGSSAGARRRAQHDPVMERLKNVDVVEELTYMVPNPCCGNESDEEDCEYYAVCDSCGEMEPLPEELKKKITGKGKKDDSTPVTYSRRQRFNFKQKNDDDEDGPPFRYNGSPGHSCRCNCCVAGLRRNPNCQCKCCQGMGTLRRCNSFDETPVGKNPQIRLIPFPQEVCKKKVEECMKVMPETSGMYKFDKKEKGFELQVPRTPTPIILEVPVPRRLGKQDLQSIARGMANKKFGVQCPATPVEAEPMFLPPIYGQCNPCCNPCNPCIPCCDPNQQQKTPGTATTNGYTSGYTYSNATKEHTSNTGTTGDTGVALDDKKRVKRKGSSSTSLPSS
ncbi:hypothetical protein Ocin01_05164 [Orchesella cincta]|uniref:Uncharacterized protein n=1 Tax=Orchesella cincta TaxID=48709 RepID=A0A1D2N8V0_ORCCI|nr:hypothetical protein Ocin01_05164 [Orchesella cincta]